MCIYIIIYVCVCRCVLIPHIGHIGINYHSPFTCKCYLFLSSLLVSSGMGCVIMSTCKILAVILVGRPPSLVMR